MPQELVEANIGGLKCDALACEYKDENVKVEDYAKYIDRPCPECGASLLTQADYYHVQNLLRVLDMFSGLPQQEVAETADGQQAKISLELNGTGELRMNIENVEKPIYKNKKE